MGGAFFTPSPLLAVHLSAIKFEEKLMKLKKTVGKYLPSTKL